MKQITLACIERGRAKSYSGKLISVGIRAITFATWDKKGSSYIKRIKKSNVIRYQIEEVD